MVCYASLWNGTQAVPYGGNYLRVVFILISNCDSEDVAFINKKKGCEFGEMANWYNFENKQANHPI